MVGTAKCKNQIQTEEGQSILEFLILLPILIATPLMLIKVNTAIQMSVVNQQYARSQALFLAFNSPVYPERRFREGPGSTFEERGVDEMVLGVSDNVAEPNYEPEASTQEIVRLGKDIGNDEPQSEDARKRGKIRIRNTVSMCTQYNGAIEEGMRFQYCRRLYQ